MPVGKFVLHRWPKLRCISISVAILFVSVGKRGKTALMLVVVSGKADVVEVLLEAKAGEDVTDDVSEGGIFIYVVYFMYSIRSVSICQYVVS
jgi:hypothetical protein